MPTSQLTSATARINHLQEPPKKPGGRLALACTVGALLVLVGLDTASKTFLPADRYASAGRSWIWWAVNDFRHRQDKADTILLGSSLMMAVQNDGDATFLNHTLDALLHWRSQYFEYKLLTMLGEKITTASFVIGGEMASDAYAIYAAMLAKGTVPKTIIWGVAPRDFLDATFPEPEDSRIVQYMSQIKGDPDLLKTGNMPLWMRVDKTLASVSSIYARRAQYLFAVQSAVSKSLSSCLPEPTGGPTIGSTAGGAGSFNGYRAKYLDDNAPGEWQTMPYGQKPLTNVDNSLEYRQRYQPFKARVLANQLGFARELLRQAKERGTHVILVNMPLQQKNLDLLPAGVYATYLKDLQVTANEGGAQLIDLNKKDLFKASDFADPVHLNGIGALKFFNYLSEHWQKS